MSKQSKYVSKKKEPPGTEIRARIARPGYGACVLLHTMSKRLNCEYERPGSCPVFLYV